MVQRVVQSQLTTLIGSGLILVLAGCASLEDRSVTTAPGRTSRLPEISRLPEPSPPRDERAPETAPSPVPDVAIARPPPAVLPPPSSSNRSVSVLLGAAQKQQANGDFDAAVATLERAVRIDSRNALAWHQLANLRYKQKNWEQAAQLALKSNSFAGADKALQARNWRLIADAKNIQGDNRAAETARQRASELEN